MSGLATAVLLAREGFDVEVFDRHRGGGGRFSGGWQVLENGAAELDALDELRALGLAPDLAVVPATRALFLDGFGRRYEIGSSAPFAYFILRGGGDGSMDGWLRRQAHAAGVALRDAEAAPAHSDVIATGPRQADGIARELVFGSDLPDTVAVLFDPLVTPTGYAYLFCLSGHATFGVAQVRKVERLRLAREEAWKRFRAVFGQFAVRGEHEGGQFMNFFLPRHLRARDGRWYGGEAAGVQDFLFGLGNRLALRTAGLAAGGLAGRWDNAAFRRTIARPMRSPVGLRFAYERIGRKGFARLCEAASRRDFRELLLRVQRPRPLLDAASRLVMAAWRERSGCRHAPLCSWCRRRDR